MYKRQAQVELMFEGCGDPHAAKEIFRKKFAEITRNPISIAKCNTRPQQGEVTASYTHLFIGKIISSDCILLRQAGFMPCFATTF